MKGPALAVMARRPVAGKVKTRLQPYLTPGQAASLYHSFLQDALELLPALSEFEPFVSYTPRSARTFFKNMTEGKAGLIPQVGSDIGERMLDLVRVLAGQGYSPIIITGSDIPLLQPRIFRKALKLLKDHDVCLGPSADGGYYLIGLKKPFEVIFRDMPWSTPDVLRLTKERINKGGLSLAALDVYQDVDTIYGLSAMKSGLERLSSLPGNRIPKHTQAWFSQNRIF